MADAKRHPTPAGTGKRPASPVSSRCVVPSLVPRREVASRYRQASPTGSKPTSSFARGGRSLSPAARLPPSTAVKVFPTVAAGIVDPAATKKTMLNIIPGICKVSAVTSMEWKGKFQGGKPEISPYLAKLGEEAVTRRSLAMAAAAEALVEAAATECMMKKLSLFSDLASASTTSDHLSTIDLFLDIYDGISSALNGREQSKSASRWVEAAMSANLEVPSLASTKITDHGASSSSKEKCKSLPTPNSMAMQWEKGYVRKESLKLGMTLLFEMKTWFLLFVKDSFEARRFEVFSGGESSESGTMAGILRQLKRVNQWLDEIGDHGCQKEIEQLKEKIYRFVIEHIGKE